ncbi:MAG: hypothetical protein KBG75_07165 [Pseudomonadales bacterium]|nr:hypothetical protein [Pseudomonadales bacterium]
MGALLAVMFAGPAMAQVGMVAVDSAPGMVSMAETVDHHGKYAIDKALQRGSHEQQGDR